MDVTAFPGIFTNVKQLSKSRKEIKVEKKYIKVNREEKKLF